MTIDGLGSGGDSGEDIIYVWTCLCPPPPPPVPRFNDCGCPVSSNERMPGGCIRVEDTELSAPDNPDTYEGVRRVKVIMKDTWFSQDVTETDDVGCWQIEEEYKGVAWMWVKFKNNRCRIRGLGSNAFRNTYRWIPTIIDYVGKIDGPVFNNIEVNYHMWDTQGSQAHRYWGASSVNNSVHEFHDFAGADNISPPFHGLDINIGTGNRFGYAVLSTQFQISFTIGTLIGAGASIFLGPIGAAVGAVSILAIWIYLPDVHIGVNFSNSDRLRRLAYHEIAHASHFTVAGSDFWEQLVLATAINGGHGSAGSPHSGVLSVAESWAEYLAHIYTDRKYGGSNSLPNRFATWRDLVEETWNETPNHIPIGLHHDLTDFGESAISCNQSGGCTTNIIDNVSGFSIKDMFGCLHPFTRTIDQYQDCLLYTSPSPRDATLSRMPSSA